MKNLFLAASVAILMTATASATVSYNTTGTFNCTDGSFSDGTLSGCGTSAVVISDLADDESITLQFNNITSTVNASTLTLASYGSIQTSCSGTDCISGATTITLDSDILSLSILISETAPDNSPDNSAGFAWINGSIAYDSSTLALGSYSGSPVTVTGMTDTVVYTMDASDNIFAPSSGVTETLGMRITDEDVASPEPGTLAMLGAGLLLFSVASRRRRS